jgi:hypothetical protein
VWIDGIQLAYAPADGLDLAGPHARIQVTKMLGGALRAADDDDRDRGGRFNTELGGVAMFFHAFSIWSEIFQNVLYLQMDGVYVRCLT